MSVASKKPGPRLSIAKAEGAARDENLAASIQTILWTLGQMLIATAIFYPQFRMRLKERNIVAQIKARDENIGRWFEFRGGHVRSRHGHHKKPDITLAFKNAALGVQLLTPSINWLNQVNAQKDFDSAVDGPEDLTINQSISKCTFRRHI